MTTPAVDLSGLKIDERARGRAGRNGRGRRGLLWGGLLVVLVAAAALLLGGRPREAQVAPVRAWDGRPAALLQASGYVTPRRRATIAAEVTGRVKEVFAEEGMRVTAGQVLALLDDDDARTRVAAAQADRAVAHAQIRDLEVQLENAQLEQRRAARLRDDGVGSDQALDAARTHADSLAR